MMGSRIKTQLLVISLTPLMLVMILVLAFFVNASKDTLEERIQYRGGEIAAQIVSMSEFYFYTGDIDRLQDVAELMINIDELMSIHFRGVDDQTIVFRELDSKDQPIRMFTVPIMAENKLADELTEMAYENEPTPILGSLTIGLSENRLTTQLAALYSRILWVGVAGMLLGMVLVYFLSRSVTRSLTSLAETAKEIEASKLYSRCPENGKGELLALQHIFNDMAESLERNEQILQTRISDATASLNASVEELSLKNDELARKRQEAISLERSKAISDERTRIMKDMHDGIGGQLVSTLAMLDRHAGDSVTEQTKTDIADTLRECLEDFRLIIHSLNINADSMEALLADFKYRLIKRLKPLNIELIWYMSESLDHVKLQPQQSLHLLRFLQEATTNTMKHSGASELSVRAVCLSEQMVSLEVSDNGQCEQYESVLTGHGIKNMQWRACELDGTLNLANESGGLCIELQIPLYKDDEGRLRIGLTSQKADQMDH
jgi:signal transduction histidine kinase